MGQIVRALDARGPMTTEDLGVVVGADYWEGGCFQRALALATSDGLVHTTSDGKVSAVG
jgi:hypothetical protein